MKLKMRLFGFYRKLFVKYGMFGYDYVYIGWKILNFLAWWHRRTLPFRYRWYKFKWKIIEWWFDNVKKRRTRRAMDL